MSEEAITNDAGQVAIKWAIERRVPKTIQIHGTDRYYVFISKFNVAMAWVEPEDVARLLAHKEKSCNCNNGVHVNAFAYANQLDVNLWVHGNRHGPAAS